jgi:hypothetical protein
MPANQLSSFHQNLLQSWQGQTAQAQQKKAKKQPKPKQEKPPKPPKVKVIKTKVAKSIQPELKVQRHSSAVSQDAVKAIAAFLKTQPEATIAQLVDTYTRRHQVYPAIDWMQEEQLIVRCGSHPTRYRLV